MGNLSRKLTVGSLFAGIGGFDLGLERAGFEIKWQVEIDPFCRAVLAKHWPEVKRYEDVRTVGSKAWADGIMDDMAASGCGDAPLCPTTYHGLESVDVICGGFPCQDISSSGDKRGLDGDRSGLWYEMWRVVRQLGPRYVLVENVADLIVRGMGIVLRDMAEGGFDAEWELLPAASFGMPQPRPRVFIIAHARSRGCEVSGQWFTPGPFACARINGDGLVAAQHAAAEAAGRVRGMDAGIPGTVDRVTALGNSIVPHIAQYIGERILEAEAGQ